MSRRSGASLVAIRCRQRRRRAGRRNYRLVVGGRRWICKEIVRIARKADRRRSSGTTRRLCGANADGLLLAGKALARGRRFGDTSAADHLLWQTTGEILARREECARRSFSDQRERSTTCSPCQGVFRRTKMQANSQGRGRAPVHPDHGAIVAGRLGDGSGCDRACYATRRAMNATGNGSRGISLRPRGQSTATTMGCVGQLQEAEVCGHVTAGMFEIP